MSETATLSSKFQISIPKAIRTAQAWEAGLTFAFNYVVRKSLLFASVRRSTASGKGFA